MGLKAIGIAAVIWALTMAAHAQVTFAPPPSEAPMPPPDIEPAPPLAIEPPQPQAPVVVVPALPPEAAAPAAPLPPPNRADHTDAAIDTLEKAGEVVKDLAKGNVKALRRGPLLIYGNYCGIGNRPGVPPVDSLDAACMRHDACTKTGNLPSCACDERLQKDATAIAADASRPEKVRALAGAMAASMAVLICK